jgi:hypothetical protein
MSQNTFVCAFRAGARHEFPTKAKALKACEYLQLTANSDNPNSRSLTFGALLDRYLAQEMPERHSTNLAYRSYLETHIRPKWSEWTLRKLTSRGASFTIEQWLKSLDLAPKTKGNIRNVMTVVFNCAMRWGLVDLGTNPLSNNSATSKSRLWANTRSRKPGGHRVHEDHFWNTRPAATRSLSVGSG